MPFSLLRRLLQRRKKWPKKATIYVYYATFAGNFLSLDFIPIPIDIILLIAYAACALLVMLRLYMWYLFPRYALLIDDVRGIAALAYSRALARGLEGKILWRMICIVVPMIVASLIPIVGQLLALLFSPLHFP